MNPVPGQEWLPTGDQAYAAMLQAVDRACASIRLETYIYAPSGIGERMRDALTRAAQRGVEVQVLIDALGSQSLKGSFWDPLKAQRGEVRYFNPLELRRLPVRNHRKLLVVDSDLAFIGGFNIAGEYEGDGIRRGWRDIGVALRGNLVAPLTQSFDEMFERASERPRRFTRWRRRRILPSMPSPEEGKLLLGVPGRGRSALQSALLQELGTAKDVRLIVPYFLPGARLRRSLQRVARRGGSVQLIVPGKSDVALSQLAAHSLYGRLLRAGVQIFEFQPQILHAKLFLIDGAVFVGSSNLDTRSLHLNYELLVRLDDPTARTAARQYFDATLGHSMGVDPAQWSRQRNFWTKLRERWAWFILARVDPWVARRLAMP